MKAVCLTTNNRPQYLKETLASLSVALRPGWKLVVRSELANECPRMLDGFPVEKHTINESPLGLARNLLQCLSDAYELGSEGILHLEDDIVLSPDAIELCDWYLSRARPEEAGIALCRKDDNLNDPSRPNSIAANNACFGLLGQGYCFNRKQFEDFVKPSWFLGREEWGGGVWDWTLAALAMENNRPILRPHLSRSRHIGAFGQNTVSGLTFPREIATGTDTKFILEE